MIYSLFLATGNAHKVEEIRQILQNVLGNMEIRILGPADFPGNPEPEENGSSFEANALIKARAWAKVSGLVALADDSGLVVDALDGRPGVLSARYAPTTEERNQRVLSEMEPIAEPARTARFVCVAALAEPSGNWTTARGEVEGIITRTPRGTAGFGYDPIFELTEPPFAGRTTAELTAEEKNSVSHRGRAIARIAPFLERHLKPRPRPL